MKRIIADDQRYVHFVTFSVYRRRNLLSLDHPKKMVLGALNTELERNAATCVGFVVMPNHLHALLWLPEIGQLSRFMHEWKRSSSRFIRQWYREQANSYFREVEFGTQLWQPKYYAFTIYSRRKIEEKLNYIHLNPVRSGLVERAIDWAWSSARWYQQGRTVGVPITWIE
jgi:putative transposase